VTGQRSNQLNYVPA